jgi:hypothetical protein
MLLYASYTGTRRNKKALRVNAWRLLMSPDTLNVAKGKRAPSWDDGTPAKYALDNGAWGCHQQNRTFDAAAFRWAYDRIGAAADWIVAPDIVGAGHASLRLTESWLPRLQHRLVLIAVQDGMNPRDIDPLMGPSRGIFLGGSTEWKLKTIAQWGKYARRIGCYYHVARVNSIRRIRMAQCAGAQSVDGTSATRFAVNVPILTAPTRQTCLFARENAWF